MRRRNLPTRRFALADDPKAEVVAGVVRRIRSACCRPQVGKARLPTSSPVHPLAARCAAAGVLSRCAGEWLKKIDAPFPDVSRHIVQTKKARAAWKRPDRRGLRVSVVNIRVAPRKRSARISKIRKIAPPSVISPRIFSAVAPARGVLPLRLGWQSIFLGVPLA